MKPLCCLLFVLCVLPLNATMTAVNGTCAAANPPTCTTATLSHTAVTAGDALVLCGHQRASSGTATPSDSNSDTSTSIQSVQGTSNTTQCWIATANSTDASVDFTATVAWSAGNNQASGTMLMAMGGPYTSVDQHAAFYQSSNTCMDVNGNTNCPPLAADRIFTLSKTGEIILAFGSVSGNSGAFCSPTPSTCAVDIGGSGSNLSFVTNATINGLNASLALGTFNSGVNGNPYGASLTWNTAHIAAIVAFTLFQPSNGPVTNNTLGGQVVVGGQAVMN